MKAPPTIIWAAMIVAIGMIVAALILTMHGTPAHHAPYQHY